MRPIVVLGAVFCFGLAVSCGGKVLAPGGEDGGSGGEEGGSGGAGGSGGVGGSSAFGGSGGVGGSGGMGGSSAFGGSGGTLVGGSGGGPGGFGGSPSCWDYLPPSTSCRQCLDANCCQQVIDCFQDPSAFCPYAIQCFENCTMGDPIECYQMCDKGSGNEPFTDLVMCGAGPCSSVCENGTPPPPPQCPVESGIPECDDCINGQCGMECLNCINNYECIDLLSCIYDCYDDACMQQCVNQHPGGANDLFAFLGVGGCVDTKCSNACGM